MKILVAYDGTLHSQTALRYGIDRVKATSGEVVSLLVFNAGLFVDYDAGPRALDAARAEFSRYIEDAKKITEEGGDVSVRILSTEGDPVQEIIRLAEAGHFDMILAPPRYKALTKSAPAPVCIIPGTILVPVDNTDAAFTNLDQIVKEAKATGSQVMLLGLIPIHIYSKWEKKDLENLKKETNTAVKRLKKGLSEQEINVADAVRSGYPDEEILKAADEYSVSIIILPTGGTTPSELSKAAAVILDEPERLKRPVFLIPAIDAA